MKYGTRRCRTCISITNRDYREKQKALHGSQVAAERESQSHCSKGHVLDKESTRIELGSKHCRICKRAYARAYNAKKRAEKALIPQ